MNKRNARDIAIAVIVGLSVGYAIFGVIINKHRFERLAQNVVEYRNISHSIVQPTMVHAEPTSAVTEIPIPTPQMIQDKPQYFPPPEDPNDRIEWGVAKQVDEHTYSIYVGHDEQMGSPQEILDALNAYRNVNKVNGLSLDEKLTAYAQSRAELFKSIENTDQHAGFNNFLENEDGFIKLGFQQLGENSYYGGPLNGTHIIEWVFAKSPGHNANQLEPAWGYVGIGVTETSANLIFAAKKL